MTLWLNDDALGIHHRDTENAQRHKVINAQYFASPLVGAIINSFPDKKYSPLEEGTMLVNWIKDADAALEQAKTENKSLLIDFSAAPA